MGVRDYPACSLTPCRPVFQPEALGPEQLKFWTATALEGKAASNSPQRVADRPVPKLLPEASAVLRECPAARAYIFSFQLLQEQ